MKTIRSCGLILFIFVSLGLVAQETAAPVRFDATLEKDLHVKRVKVGDACTARVKTAAVLKDGTAIPKNAKLLGHVTDVKAKPDQSGPSRLAILFDKVVTGKDEEKPISVTLVSVAPPNELRGVNQLASQSGMTGAGRVSAMSSQTGRASTGQSSENVLSSGLGANSGGPGDPELRPGISGIEGISITYKSSGPDTILENNKEGVYIQRWTRMLFQAN